LRQSRANTDVDHTVFRVWATNQAYRERNDAVLNGVNLAIDGGMAPPWRFSGEEALQSNSG
jgi:hypothetical protein